MADVARFREAFGDGQAGAGVAAIEDIVCGFTAAREPPDAVELTERPEALQAASQELVRVGLVARVPHDPVTGRLEQPVERDRQLHDAQGRPQVTAGRRDGLDDGLADLESQLGQLDLVHPAQIGR